MTDPTQPPTQPPTEPAAQPATPAYAAPAGSETAAGAPVSGSATDFPGKILGIVAIPVAIFFNVIGLILGFVARSQSKKAGYKNTPATIAIIIGAVLFVVGIIVGIVLFAVVFNAASDTSALCDGQAPGVYQLTDGSTITCE